MAAIMGMVAVEENGMKTAAIYSRTLSDHETTENQERELREVAASMGWRVLKAYRDEGVDGTGSRRQTLALDALRRDCARRQFDIIMAWSIDLFGAPLHDALGFLFELHVLKIDLYLHQERLDTTMPSGRTWFQMMLGALPELERAMIRERLKSGPELPKRQCRKRGRPKVAQEIEDAIRLSLIFPRGGTKSIAKKYGVSSGTVKRIKKDLTP
jgi:DNA invertase Pin-like site-specific DNA recombinase